jgi:hypothetical protein
MDTCTRVDVDVAVQDETLPCAVAGNHIACRFFGRWHTSDVTRQAEGGSSGSKGSCLMCHVHSTTE